MDVECRPCPADMYSAPGASHCVGRPLPPPPGPDGSVMEGVAPFCLAPPAETPPMDLRVYHNVILSHQHPCEVEPEGCHHVHRLTVAGDNYFVRGYADEMNMIQADHFTDCLLPSAGRVEA